MSRYAAERKYFKSFKENVGNDALREYEIGIKELLLRYNTTIYENRFIVGGVVEFFTLALLRSGGVQVGSYGDETAKGDLILPGNKMLSVKSRFSEGRSAIRLINTMGDSNPVWNTATLFVISSIGVIYGDPEMVDEDHLKKTKDALTLSDRCLTQLADNKEYVLPLEIPYKPPKEVTRYSHKASAPVARKLMLDCKLRTLLGHIGEA